MAKSFKFDGLIKQAEQQKKAAEARQKDSESFIKNNIQIDEVFKDFIPPLIPEEYSQLEDNILAEGCRDPLVLWKRDDAYILIDGHNRYSICQRHQLDFKVEVKEFENEEAVHDWMVANQLGKRNVTDETKSYLRGLQYNREKKKAGNLQNLKQFTEEDKLSPSGKTADRLAEQHKVSDKTIKRDEKYALAIDKLTGDDQQLKWNILNRNLLLPKGSVMKLADKDQQEVRKVGKALSEGEKFKQALDKVFNPSKPQKPKSPYYEHLMNLRGKIIDCLDQALDDKDPKALNEIATLLEDFEKSLGKE